jgi:hypothetical protein
MRPEQVIGFVVIIVVWGGFYIWALSGGNKREP